MPIYDYGEVDGHFYTASRFIDGRSLELILAGGPLDPGRAALLISQVANVLAAVRRLGLIGTVKPSKILVTPDDTVHLITFTFEFQVVDNREDPDQFASRLRYAAPELFRGDSRDARTDTYALASVLYLCLTGQRPYPGDTMEAQLTGLLTVPPPRPSLVQAGVSPEFDAIIAKGLAKNPDDRYQSASDLAAAIRGIQRLC